MVQGTQYGEREWGATGFPRTQSARYWGETCRNPTFSVSTGDRFI